MWVCRVAVYLSFALVAVSGLWLVMQYERERHDEESFRGAVRFSEVRATEGATLRVEGGRLELTETPSGGLSVGYGPGPHRGTQVLLIALCVSTVVLGAIVMELMKRQSLASGLEDSTRPTHNR